jgi:hypothetical protein
LYSTQKIQIGIPCGPNSELFANFLIRSIEKTISNEFDYSFIIGINKNGVNRAKIVENFDIKKFHFVEETSSEQSSLGHAHCLNLILKNMDSKWGFLIDSDVALLAKDWDKILISQLNNKVIMIGSQYHHSDGKMINRPNVITCAIDVEVFHQLKIDFTPSLKHIEANDYLSNIYGVRKGSKFFLDTGCEIIEAIIKSGYGTEVMNIVSPRYSDTHQNLRLLKLGERGEEYHFNEMPISTHIGRSLTRNFNEDHVVVSWKNRVSEWLDGKI